MRKYMSFLINTLMRKVSLWIIAIIYAISLVAFSIVVPFLMNMPVLYVWTGDTKIILLAPLMVTAIFSAMIAVYIFREPQEDGTELMICSKPIKRQKLILGKLFAFWIFLAFFAIIPVGILSIMFAFPQFNNEMVM